MLPKWSAKGNVLYYDNEIRAMFKDEEDADRAAKCLQALNECQHPEEFDYRALKEAFAK